MESNVVLDQKTYPYSLLWKISQVYESRRKKFENVYILACQHILEPQARMFELLADFGVPKKNIHIFGKIYSTSFDVLKEMENNGFNVSQPNFNPSISFDSEHSENCKRKLDLFLSSIKSPSKIIILDDGGELLKVVNDKFTFIPQHIEVVGIEQTSSGFRKLEHSELHFPIFNVARSNVKLIQESPLIANLGCNRMIEVFEQYQIKEPRILVVGLGPIGKNTLEIFKEKGYLVFGYDIAHHDKSELIQLIKINNVNVVVGVTGSSILDEKQFQEIKDTINNKLFLISMSSADREFPATYIRKHGIAPEKVHGNVVWDNLILINNGFPITFKGKRYESTPEEIEKTIGLLYGSVLQSIVEASKKTGFIEVPKIITDILENTYE